MSLHIRDYWRLVRELEARLPEFVWLVAVDVEPARFVTEVKASMAARFLHEKTHRVATAEEVGAHQEREKAWVKQAKQERMHRGGAAQVVLEPGAPDPATRPSRRRPH